jgi:hypothetical protein
VGWREMSNAYRIFMSKTLGEHSAGRSRRRLEDNFKIDIRKGGGGLNWLRIFPVAGCGISSVEPPDSANTALVS